MSNEGVKYDTDKPRTDLLSRVALEGVARVLAYGANKYAADNWRHGMAWRRLIGAALRHLLAFSDGEDIDPESSLPHIDHAACCLMFLSEYQKKALGTDDRFRDAWKEPDKDDTEAFLKAWEQFSDKHPGVASIDEELFLAGWEASKKSR